MQSFGRFFFTIFMAIGSIGLLNHGPCSGQNTEPSAAVAAATLPWHIQANTITYDFGKKEYRALGEAKVWQLDKTLKADDILFNAQTMEAEARGGVMMKMGGDELTASKVHINLVSEQGVLHDGEVFLKESNFFIKGKKIQKTEGFTFSVEDAQVTSCEGEVPDWHLSGKRLDVTLDEYGFVKHGRFWVKNTPVFYSPFFVFPVKLERQSGLLMPQFGISNKKGIDIEQPVFWAISDSSDLTFFEHFMAQRGNRFGLEYRYMEDAVSKGTIKIDYLKDRQVDDGMGSSEWGYAHDDFLRPNANRYWIRAKHDQALPMGFFGKLDLDIVSDQDYLIEFRDGASGFKNDLSDYQKTFSRILDSYEDPVRVNQLNVNKKGMQYTWNTNLRWYDDVVSRKYLDDNKTLQKLPQIQVGTLKRQIADLPLYVQLNSDYSYFYSPAGTNGHRLDIYPTVHLPLLSTPYFAVAPYMGVRETLWQITDYADEESEREKENRHHRHLVDFHLDINSELNRVYRMERDTGEAVQHLIYPEIRYAYVPKVNQDQYPEFDSLTDGINRVDDTHRVSFYLAQLLTAKMRTGESGETGKSPDGSLPYIYKRLLRFTLEQTYDIQEVLSQRPEDYRNGVDKEPFLPLEVEFELIPNDFFSISANTRWDHYDHRLVERNTGLNFQTRRGDRLGIGYRFTEDVLETLTLTGAIKLTQGLTTFGEFERNLLENETVGTGLGFFYERQCWSFELNFIDRQEDRKYQFMVNLKGLGGVGSN